MTVMNDYNRCFIVKRIPLTLLHFFLQVNSLVTELHFISLDLLPHLHTYLVLSSQRTHGPS